MKLGEKILKLRKQYGFSQEELGEKLDVTMETISNWELAETQPNLNQLKLLSKEFNISIDELLDNEVKYTKENNNNTFLKIIKIILIIFAFVLILVIILYILFKANKRYNGAYIEESIYCTLYNESHGYTIKYEELTGLSVEEGGDTYFNDILNLGQYNDAHQKFNIINDYVKKNGGICEMINNRDLSYNNLVNMYIKEGTLTKTSATVIIEDNNPNKIVYGDSFWLEKYENGKWIEPEKSGINYGFNSIAYYVNDNGILELNQNWSHMYKKLDSGIYRIVKDVFFESDIPVVDNMFYIWCEFEIE